MLTSTLAKASSLPASRLTLDDLIHAIAHAVAETPPDLLPQAVCRELREHLPRLVDLLTPEQRQGNPERYTRHILYAHPQGLFTVLALVWRPGQVTPVHGHYTWCSYYILEGEMQEEHFAWDREQSCAHLYGQVARSSGDSAASQAGLDQIHRLINNSSETAVSIHVYGVDAPRVATHVNRIAEISPA